MSEKSSGGQQTDVQGLAAWALRATWDDLSATSQAQAPIHLLDCLGCAIGALTSEAVRAMRRMITAEDGEGPAPMLGGGSSSTQFAAMWHTALTRYLDFMDNFLAAKETCHTADNFGAVLTAAVAADASGEQFLTAMAVAYTAQSRYVDHGLFMTRGLDHTAQLGFSIPAGVGPLLGLSAPQLAAAAAMAGASDSSYGVIRAKPLTMWKGLASSQSALGAMNAVLLAKQGVLGPLNVIEGPNGVDQLLGSPIDIDWNQEGYEGFATSTVKAYNSEIHTQSAIHAMLCLRHANSIDPSTVRSITAETTQITYDFAGGGSYGNAKTNIDSKSQADHSLPYLLAVALLDGEVRPAQFTQGRIGRPDVQDLLQKVTVRPDDDFTKQYPEYMPAKVTVTTNDGKSVSEQVRDFPGMPVDPMTWDAEVEKFHRLVDPVVDGSLADELVSAVRDAASTSARDLWRLLADVNAPAA